MLAGPSGEEAYQKRHLNLPHFYLVVPKSENENLASFIQKFMSDVDDGALSKSNKELWTKSLPVDIQNHELWKNEESLGIKIGVAVFNRPNYEFEELLATDLEPELEESSSLNDSMDKTLATPEKRLRGRSRHRESAAEREQTSRSSSPVIPITPARPLNDAEKLLFETLGTTFEQACIDVNDEAAWAQMW